jgi:transglutaminase-like putative cysteine protease
MLGCLNIFVRVFGTKTQSAALHSGDCHCCHLLIRVEVLMPIFVVKHTTIYRYAREVSFGEHRLMFRPRDSYDQRLLESSMLVEPEPREVRWIHDVFGNCVAVVSFSRAAKELRFETCIRLDHTSDDMPDFRIDPSALNYPFAYDRDEFADLACTIERHYPDENDDVRKWAKQFVCTGGRARTGNVLMTLCYAIHEGFMYSRRVEPGTQPPVLTLHQRRGTCRDLALLMMEAVRSLGFAARFVTGYLYVPGNDGVTTRGGGSTHAWCQVYLPGAGWVEFDPTNGIVGNRDLIRVAVSRDPGQAIPLYGSYSGRASDALEMTVQVNVTKEAGNDS